MISCELNGLQSIEIIYCNVCVCVCVCVCACVCVLRECVGMNEILCHLCQQSDLALISTLAPPHILVSSKEGFMDQKLLSDVM